MASPFLSPLRYPGGKARLGLFFERLLIAQPDPPRVYVEPFSGGVGAGLFLLDRGAIDHLVINDLNPGIAAFWRCVKHDGQRLANRIAETRPDIKQWHIAHRIYQDPGCVDDFDLGFATFFLNRCNRSGILTARPIGGLSQTGNWKIDARYNADDLASRVLAIHDVSDAIEVHQEEASDLIRRLMRRTRRTLFYVDPPYVQQGNELYLSKFGLSEHSKLARLLVSTKRHPWVLTYDAVAEIRRLYSRQRCMEFSISHTAQRQHVGDEFIFFSDDLHVPDQQVLPRHRGEWCA